MAENWLEMVEKRLFWRSSGGRLPIDDEYVALLWRLFEYDIFCFQATAVPRCDLENSSTQISVLFSEAQGAAPYTLFL